MVSNIQSPQNTSPSILLIKRGALGDILMTTPLIRQLKQALPNCAIDFLLASSFASVVVDNPYLNKVIGVDNSLFSIKKIPLMLKKLYDLRANHYDYVFVLDKHYYFTFLAFIVSSGISIGFMRDKLARLFLNKMVVYNDVQRYHVLYYLDLLSASGLAVANYNDIALDFIITDTNVNIVDNWLSNADIKTHEFIVVANSGGNNEFETTGGRMLPLVKILELLTTIANTWRLPILLLGSEIDAINYAKY